MASIFKRKDGKFSYPFSFAKVRKDVKGLALGLGHKWRLFVSVNGDKKGALLIEARVIASEYGYKRGTFLTLMEG